jgi:D-lactate dehydrogenase
MKILFYSIKAFEKPFLIEANKNQHHLHFTEQPLSQETAYVAKGFDCVSLFTADDGSASVLNRLKNLGVKQVSVRATGYDNVDIETAGKIGLQVANVPGYSPNAIAEHAVAMMLSLNRKLVIADQQVHQHNFTLDRLVGFDFNNKTIGIIGLGKIGSIVARIMRGFGCRILAYDIAPEQSYIDQFGVTYVDLATLCRESDVISIHAPLNAATKYMINDSLFKQMKKGVMIINTGRGGVIKTEDLIDYLKNGQVGSCGLDVYENEKGIFFFDHSAKNLDDAMLAQLLSFPNVLLTPHQAFATNEALEGIAAITFDNISAWAEDRICENELTPLLSIA